jgi:hypothetical protein
MNTAAINAIPIDGAPEGSPAPSNRTQPDPGRSTGTRSGPDPNRSGIAGQD